MRTVSFVDYFELDYNGNVYSKAMLTADVDNDNLNELVIGNVFGDLYIYRGLAVDGKPWAKASDLGLITCIQVGDVCNYGMNCLVTLSAEGWCHMFEIRPDTPLTVQEGETIDDVKILKAVFKQRIFANCKSLVIADIDGDGLNELVVAHTDRVVRAYRWTSVDDGQSSSGSVPSSGSTAKGQTVSKLVLIDRWILLGQIGSITASQSVSGQLSILVSQPGGSFVTLVPNSSLQNQSSTTEDNPPTDVNNDSTSMLFHALGSVRARNPGVTTEVVGSISRVKKPSCRQNKDQCTSCSSSSSSTAAPCNYYSAICTLDGTITLLDEDKILWSLYVDHQLFSLNKVDVTGDGMEEVVACSWDGQTYFINISKEVVRFHFRENVAAFCAGMYSLDRDRGNVPCLFYATFNNKIFVYYNIYMAQIGTTNLLHTMQQMTSADPSHSRLHQVLSSTPNLHQLCRWSLYGDHSRLLAVDESDVK